LLAEIVTSDELLAAIALQAAGGRVTVESQRSTPAWVARTP
jgi:hypothetical protein